MLTDVTLLRELHLRGIQLIVMIIGRTELLIVQIQTREGKQHLQVLKQGKIKVTGDIPLQEITGTTTVVENIAHLSGITVRNEVSLVILLRNVAHQVTIEEEAALGGVL